jgi:hypothetical protein
MSKTTRKERASRADIANTAARLLVEGAAGDFASAKRKAAQQLGVAGTRRLPDNLELQAAVAGYQRLFQNQTHRTRVRQLRLEALKAMKYFATFGPRLVGPVLYGTACDDTPVTLHLFTDTVEDLSRHLIDKRIPYRICDRAFRFSSTVVRSFPVLKICFGGTDFELVVFTQSERTRIPLSPLDGRPFKRAKADDLETLLSEDRIDGASHLEYPDPLPRN